ncbi:esterase [Klebsiella oxytoca]|nr:esterase [Klebsiella oxytoca]
MPDCWMNITAVCARCWRAARRTASKPCCFSLPVNRASSLVLHGEEGARWRFQWQMRETTALAKIQTLDPVSPRLQLLKKELAAGGSTATFWRERELEGTPMVESVDASHKRVTFLWRGASRNVFILGSPAGDHDPAVSSR